MCCYLSPNKMQTEGFEGEYVKPGYVYPNQTFILFCPKQTITVLGNPTQPCTAKDTEVLWKENLVSPTVNPYSTKQKITNHTFSYFYLSFNALRAGLPH